MIDLFTEGEYTPAHDALWIRQSTVGSWELCPGRVMQSKHARFNELPSEAMSFGTLVHAMIELELTGARGRVPWTTMNVSDLWDELALEEYGVSLADLADDDLILDSSIEAVGAVMQWRRQVQQTLPNGDMLIERRLEAPLGVLPNGREVWLHGTGDLLYTDIAIGYDWKTAGRGWKETKATYLGQPSAYAYLHWYNHNVWVERWRYWVYNRGSARWDLHTTYRNRQQVASWLRHAFGIACAIDAGVVYYTPTQHPYGKSERGWWCSPRYCAAWDHCPGKYLADGYDEKQLAIINWTE